MFGIRYARMCFQKPNKKQRGQRPVNDRCLGFVAKGCAFKNQTKSSGKNDRCSRSDTDDGSNKPNKKQRLSSAFCLVYSFVSYCFYDLCVALCVCFRVRLFRSLSFRLSVLVQYGYDYSGSYRSSAFSNRKSQSFFDRDRGDELDFHVDVVSRHDHFYSVR